MDSKELYLNNVKKRKREDKIATVLLYIIACFFLILLGGIIVYVVGKGVASFMPQYISFDKDGLGVELFNTVYMVLITQIIFRTSRRRRRHLHGGICKAG